MNGEEISSIKRVLTPSEKISDIPEIGFGTVPIFFLINT